MLFVHRHPDVAASIAAAGRRTVVENFGIQRQMQKYADLYKMMFFARLDTSDGKLLRRVVEGW